MERIPPMEEQADRQGKDKSEELARREKLVHRLKDDNAALALIMMTIDNNAISYIIVSFAKLVLEKSDDVYNRQGQMLLFAERKKLYLLGYKSFDSLSALFSTHETLIRKMEIAGEISLTMKRWKRS